MRLALVGILLLPLAVTGCGVSDTAAPTPLLGASIKGHVHGGQQPIAGSLIYLFAAGTTGYGAVSQSLLTSATGYPADGNGDYYTESGPDGGFDLTGLYSCTQGQQVYVYVTGGDPTPDTPNAAIALMAVLGECSSLDNFSSVPYIEVNELSTVAAAYALAGFTTDARHISDDEGVVTNPTASQAQAGMATAFANAANLVDLGSGTALTTNPNDGVVPTQELDTLGDILAACVNTDGATTAGNACGTLFTAATSDGTSSGTQPTDTFTALFNIVNHPGAPNITALWSLPTAQSPFQPPLKAQPKDFSVIISYSANGKFIYPASIGITPTNVYVGDFFSGVYEFSPTGDLRGVYCPFDCATSKGAGAVAVDQSGNLWAAGVYTKNVVEFVGGPASDPIGTSYSGSGASAIQTPESIAIDAAGNAWVANYNTSSTSNLVEITSVAPNYIASYNTYAPSGTNTPVAVAVDAFGNKWFLDLYGDATVLGPTKAVVSPTGGYTDSSMDFSTGIAIDFNNNAWIANEGTDYITKISNLGPSPTITGFLVGSGTSAVAIDGIGDPFGTSVQGGTCALNFYGSGGSTSSPPVDCYGTDTITNPFAVAVDGSGDLWVANGVLVFEYIGLAQPVVTPLAVAIFNNKLADLP